MADNKKVWKIWHSGTTIEEFAQTIEPGDYVQILCPEEYEASFNFKYKQLIEAGATHVDIVFGSYDRYYYKRTTDALKYPKLNLQVWGNFFLYYAIAFMSMPFVKTLNKDKLFTCLNNAPHTHRVMLIDTLAKYELLDNNYYSWHNLNFTDMFYEIKYWTPKIVKLDGSVTSYSLSRLPDEVYRSVLNLVSESTSNVPFITEKTYNNIIRKQPFVIFGCKGINKKLEDDGFKLPRDIINYSFDDEANEAIRAELLAIEMKRLSEFDLNELSNALTETAEYNFKHAINIIKTRTGIPAPILTDDYYYNLVNEATNGMEQLLNDINI